MEPQRLSPSQYEALADFRYELRHFLRFSERAAHASGLEPVHQTQKRSLRSSRQPLDRER